MPRELDEAKEVELTAQQARDVYGLLFEHRYVPLEFLEAIDQAQGPVWTGESQCEYVIIKIKGVGLK